MLSAIRVWIAFLISPKPARINPINRIASGIGIGVQPALQAGRVGFQVDAPDGDVVAHAVHVPAGDIVLILPGKPYRLGGGAVDGIDIAEGVVVDLPHCGWAGGRHHLRRTEAVGMDGVDSAAAGEQFSHRPAVIEVDAVSVGVAVDVGGFQQMAGQIILEDLALRCDALGDDHQPLAKSVIEILHQALAVAVYEIAGTAGLVVADLAD